MTISFTSLWAVVAGAWLAVLTLRVLVGDWDMAWSVTYLTIIIGFLNFVVWQGWF